MEKGGVDFVVPGVAATVVGVVLTTAVAVGTAGGGAITGKLGRTVFVGTELTCGCAVSVACGGCVTAGVGVGLGLGLGVGVSLDLGVGKMSGTVGSTAVETSVFELTA
jgi:hypothetical protein